MQIEKLVKGFRKFRSSYFSESNHYEKLVRRGQSPETLVIACSDSRNDPALLMQSKPGDIFVVRNVAAIVPPYQPDDHYHGTSAGIEFAVRGLKVKNVVVLGHALCGGVLALLEQAESAGNGFEFLSQWISIGEPARRTVEGILSAAEKPVKLRALEQAMILTSLNNLMTFPWIKSGVQDGSISLHGWYFDMVEGALLGYDFAGGQFTEIGRKAGDVLENPQQADSCCTPWSLEKLVESYLSPQKNGTKTRARK